MTIGELEEILSHIYPKEMKILVDGYDDGYDEISTPEQKVVYPDEYAPSWSGRYNDDNKYNVNGETVLILSR